MANFFMNIINWFLESPRARKKEEPQPVGTLLVTPVIQVSSPEPTQPPIPEPIPEPVKEPEQKIIVIVLPVPTPHMPVLILRKVEE